MMGLREGDQVQFLYAFDLDSHPIIWFARLTVFSI